MVKAQEGEAGRARLLYDVDDLGPYFEERGEEAFQKLMSEIRDNVANKSERTDILRKFVNTQGMTRLKNLFSVTNYDGPIAEFGNALLLKYPYALDDTDDPISGETLRIAGGELGEALDEQDVRSEANVFGPGEGRKVKYSDKEITLIRNAISRGVNRKEAYTEYLRDRVVSRQIGRNEEGFRKKYFRMKKMMKEEGLI